MAAAYEAPSNLHAEPVASRAEKIKRLHKAWRDLSHVSRRFRPRNSRKKGKGSLVVADSHSDDDHDGPGPRPDSQDIDDATRIDAYLASRQLQQLIVAHWMQFAVIHFISLHYHCYLFNSTI